MWSKLCIRGLCLMLLNWKKNTNNKIFVNIIIIIADQPLLNMRTFSIVYGCYKNIRCRIACHNSLRHSAEQRCWNGLRSKHVNYRSNPCPVCDIEPDFGAIKCFRCDFLLHWRCVRVTIAMIIVWTVNLYSRCGSIQIPFLD